MNQILQKDCRRFWRSEQGDIVSALGWMAIMALVLVALKTIVDTGVTSYADQIFTKLNSVFSGS